MIKILASFSDNPARKSPTQSQKGVAQYARMIKGIFFGKTSQNDPMNTLKAVFTKLPKNFSQKAESFSFNSESGKNNYKFFKKTTFLPSFPVDT